MTVVDMDNTGTQNENMEEEEKQTEDRDQKNQDSDVSGVGKDYPPTVIDTECSEGWQENKRGLSQSRKTGSMKQWPWCYMQKSSPVRIWKLRRSLVAFLAEFQWHSRGSNLTSEGFLSEWEVRKL